MDITLFVFGWPIFSVVSHFHFGLWAPGDQRLWFVELRDPVLRHHCAAVNSSRFATSTTIHVDNCS